MSIDHDQAIQSILDFMGLIHECHARTTFAEDRVVYTQDLMEAMGWLVRLRQGDELENVIEEILSEKTEKHFGDYWRQGTWGDKEASGLKSLKQKMR